MNYPPYEEQQAFDKLLIDILLWNPVEYMEIIKKSLNANQSLTPEEREKWYRKIEEVIYPERVRQT